MASLKALRYTWLNTVRPTRSQPKLRNTSPRPPDEETARRMRRVRQRDTAPERRLRSALHARGLRFRVDIAPLLGSRRRADVVFTRARLAVFVDGCFWHRCPIDGTVPRHNREWWLAKLDGNVRRDRSTDQQLEMAGWAVTRVWEHEAPELAAVRIEKAYRARLDRLESGLHRRDQP